jgi:acyl-coenzyme A synthetase/AMP-(fatty) acid ligase
VPIGPPWQWAKVRVVDPDDVRGPSVPEGELLVSSPTMMAGYWGGRFPEVFVDVEEGQVTQRYYRTGDIVRKDAGGRLFFRGRNDRLIKSRGQRVDLDDVESTLCSLDGVAEAAVYVAPGDDGSARIHAAIIPADGFSSDREIMVELQSLLSPAAIPVQILVLDEFPRTTSGKIDRRALATLLN